MGSSHGEKILFIIRDSGMLSLIANLKSVFGGRKKMSEYQHVTQPFAPIYDAQSVILILGSVPSVKSREQGFYYGHPKNRFWRLLAELLEAQMPSTIEEKKKFLLEHHIALYDVIESCDIKASSDSSICNVIPADMDAIILKSNVKAVFCNGKTAGRLYRRYQMQKNSLPMIELPSTSPANASFSLEKLVDVWGREISQYLKASGS
jgi:hypoxanthine-DNA glycosylase